ncbi:hypothetical protein WI94_05645 [Burkholderia vietnamiensis]|nr:hypothetical protein WI94_05645 [Burkholderia vietnamiensis]KVE82766.1 hypothetical protein WJ00_22245 [Burkholderia vietnamiensis]
MISPVDGFIRCGARLMASARARRRAPQLQGHAGIVPTAMKREIGAQRACGVVCRYGRRAPRCKVFNAM